MILLRTRKRGCVGVGAPSTGLTNEEAGYGAGIAVCAASGAEPDKYPLCGKVGGYVGGKVLSAAEGVWDELFGGGGPSNEELRAETRKAHPFTKLPEDVVGCPNPKAVWDYVNSLHAWTPCVQLLDLNTCDMMNLPRTVIDGQEQADLYDFDPNLPDDVLFFQGTERRYIAAVMLQACADVATIKDRKKIGNYGSNEKTGVELFLEEQDRIAAEEKAREEESAAGAGWSSGQKLAAVGALAGAVALAWKFGLLAKIAKRFLFLGPRNDYA